MKKAILAGVLVVLLVLTAVAAMRFFGGKEYTGYASVHEIEARESATYFYTDKKLISYGQEGAQAIAADGSLLWNITYKTMKNPIFSFCKDMMLVADVGTKEFLLSDGTGVAKTHSVPYQIQSVSVSRQGVCTILMNEEEKDYIYMYDKDGVLLSEIETVVSRDGFPITLALSEDGTKLVTSYMKIENDEPVGCVTFYNFGGVGQNYSRNLVGQIQYEKCLVPRIEFWGNDTVAVLGENTLELFAMKEIPSSIMRKEIVSTVRSVAFGEYFCMISKNAEGQDVLEAYDKSGKVRMMKVIAFPYIGFQTEGKEVVLYSHSGCEIYTIGKDTCYKGTFEGGVRNLYAIGGNRYYLVENKKGSIIKLVH